MTAHSRRSLSYGRKLISIETVVEPIPLLLSDVGEAEVLKHLGRGGIERFQLW